MNRRARGNRLPAHASSVPSTRLMVTEPAASQTVLRTTRPIPLMAKACR
jgi:hypothetical protein